MNKSELEHIAAAYYEEIYLFCLRKVNYDEHLARDLVQDVFLSATEYNHARKFVFVRPPWRSSSNKKTSCTRSLARCSS